jgi:Ca-activated chloride channel family protein
LAKIEQETKMNNRIMNPSKAERTAFGLIAWLEKTKISLPLKGVECAFNVCGDVVSVEIDQAFHQNSKQPLDCLYTFPLPAGAAVYRCEMHLDGRIIRARVEERERAREIAQEKKAAGFRTALVEMERDNLFTLSLGNVQPGDMIVIRFAYFQTLNRLGDWTSFSIPFCPGIRYVPGVPLIRAPKGKGTVDDTDQVPDASRISPPRIDRLHPDVAYLSVEGIVEHPLNDLKDISSPSHPVFVKSGQGSSNVTIADQAAVPDCDFVLRWTELQTQEVKPMGWQTRTDATRTATGATFNGESFALIRLRAPERVAVSDNYSQDVYFLIDRSGSMHGLKWHKAVEAFREFVKGLGKEDRVWATFFESSVRDLVEAPVPAHEVLADRAVQNLEALGTTGGTELLPALQHVLSKIAIHSTERPKSLVLITDGQVGNEAHILKALSPYTQLRVHVFGIDIAINDGFLQKLAAQHQGTSCLMSPRDDIVGAVARLGNRLRRPAWTSIRVQDGWEIVGQTLPDLYEGQVLSLPLKGSGSARTVTLEGKLPDGTSKSFQFELVETSAIALPLLWAKRRIEFHLAKGETQEAIALAKANNIVCEGAAFIAWDESEKVPVSAREVYQPAMELQVGSVQFARARFASASAGAVRGLHELSSEADELGYSGKKARKAYCHPLKESLFDRLRHRWLGEPNVEGDLIQFRQKLSRDILFQSTAGQHLLDLLADWIRSHPKQTNENLRKLLILQTKLQQASAKALAERLDIVRQWILQTLADEIQTRSLEKLRQIEDELLPKTLKT